MDTAEGKLSDNVGADSGTSRVSGEVSVRLQSELVMGDRVGEMEEGPLARETADMGVGRDVEECELIGMLLRGSIKVLTLVGGSIL